MAAKKKTRARKTPKIVPVRLLGSMGSENHNWIAGEIYPATAREAKRLIEGGMAELPPVESDEDPVDAFVRVAQASGVESVAVPAGNLRTALDAVGIETWDFPEGRQEAPQDSQDGAQDGDGAKTPAEPPKGGKGGAKTPEKAPAKAPPKKG